ncbi:MAG: photosynthetic complex assembly protein PuhC [Anderseniella sp.]|nr:photosynthetic complex assembly protein PuhC [Anderseniella sp.]
MNRQPPDPGPAYITRTGLGIIAAVAMSAFVLVGGAKLTGLKDNTDPAYEVTQVRDLRFLDGADGSVLIIDATTGDTVSTIAPGSNGFLRATMRGLVRQRQIKGIGSEPPFKLVHYVSGHVSMIDPETGASVALDAFGQTNAAVFARLLKEQKS